MPHAGRGAEELPIRSDCPAEPAVDPLVWFGRPLAQKNKEVAERLAGNVLHVYKFDELKVGMMVASLAVQANGCLDLPPLLVNKAEVLGLQKLPWFRCWSSSPPMREEATRRVSNCAPLLVARALPFHPPCSCMLRALTRSPAQPPLTPPTH